MKDFLNRFKIPTILGLSLIIFGIVVGVFLNLRQQSFISKASPDITAQNITLANITDNSIAISWQTAAAVVSFITFGQSSVSETSVLDDRDINTPKAYSIHYFTLKNLLPKTTYQYKIVSGKISSEINKFTTASPLSSQTGFRPIIGTALDGDKPLNEAVVYLSIAEAATQSFLIKDSGNFLIPLSQMRKSDLSDSFPLTQDSVAKLTFVSEKGEASALFKIKDAKEELPPISLGENLDLTQIISQEIYDLNEDGKINAADNAIILDVISKKTINKKADLNEDGKVDQKDLDLMAKQINQ